MQTWVTYGIITAVLLLIVGVMGYGWYVTEISALFLAMGITSGLVMGAGANKIALEFLAGAKDILTAAIIVGLVLLVPTAYLSITGF